MFNGERGAGPFMRDRLSVRTVFAWSFCESGVASVDLRQVQIRM